MADAVDLAIEELRAILLPPGAVADSLRPLVANMLREHYDRLPDQVAQAIAPVIAQAIRVGLSQGRTDIVEALEPIISEGLSEQIRASPERLAGAVGPAVDQAIQGCAAQLREDILRSLRPVISEVLQERIDDSPQRFAQPMAPVVDEAMQRQVAAMRQDLVDALQPLVRQATEEAVSEAVGDLSQSWVARMLLGLPKQPRPQPSRVAGHPEASEPGPEGRPLAVEEVLLLHRETGATLYHGSDPTLPPHERAPDEEMLAAIRDFAREFLQAGECRGFTHGDRRVLVAAGESARLAVVGQGTEPSGLCEEMQSALAAIHEDHGASLADIQGEDDQLVNTVEGLLIRWLQQPRPDSVERPSASRSRRLIVAAALLLALLLLLLGCGWWVWRVERALAASPAASQLRLTSTPMASLVPTSASVSAIAHLGQTFTPTTAPIASTTPSLSATPPPTSTSTWTPTPTHTPTEMPTQTPTPVPTETRTLTPSPTPTPTHVSGVMIGNVYLRDVPSLDAEKPGKVARLGARVELLAQYGEWLKVRAVPSDPSRPSVVGWLPARWVDAPHPVPAEMVTPTVDC